MFYPSIIGSRKSWGITRRISPGANSFILAFLALTLLIFLPPEGAKTTLASNSLSKEAATSLAPYPSSPVIDSISFDLSSHQRLTPGSDNWAITWADDGHQYTSWGDGGGFGGTNSDGRVSLGVARIEGDWDDYQGSNIWGGKNPDNRATFGGKSCGIISIDGVLYMWVSPGSTPRTYREARLYRSTDHGANWQGANWHFFDDEGIILPTILQFGRDYAGARDDYVYHYAAGLEDSSGHVIQKPGEIYLFRFHKNQIFSPKSNYQFFNGLDGSGNPIWSNDVNSKKPVFEVPNGAGPKVAVSYNAGLGRYLLTTEHTESSEGNLGIFDAPEPWGPWTVVAYMKHSDNAEFGHGDSDIPDTTFFWNFSNKWLSSDGQDFTLIFTGRGANDSWNTVRGRFKLVSTAPQPTPVPPVSSVWPVPGRIEAEAYKAGGEGVGYHDTTSGNSGGEYRNDDVDIQAADDAGGGYNVGWIRQGEWLAYDVQAAQAGSYDITARVASARAGVKSFHVEVDGVDVSGPLSFTDASGWQSWLDITAKGVNLTAGPHQLRIVMDAGYFNVNYLEVTPSANHTPILGDANLDDQFTRDDIYLAVDWIIGRQSMPQAGAPAFAAADVDSDGNIASRDVVLMISRLLGP